MIIFIDESGTFANPQEKKSAVSCVGALVIPETYQDRLYAEFASLKKSWGYENAEIKGSRLDERQVQELVAVCSKYDVILQVVATDLGVTSNEQLKAHQAGQAENLRKSVEGTNYPSAPHFIKLADRVAKLSGPLYVQSNLLTLLVDEILRTGTLYYSQREPLCLGNFMWVIDAKDKTRTEYEDLWQALVMPHLQWLSMQESLDLVEGFNYSAFGRFMKTMEEPPAHLAPHLKRRRDGPFKILDVNQIMEVKEFSDSKSHLGLQLIDLLVTAVRRALSGTLQASGWKHLGKLMVQAKKGEHAVRLVSLGGRRQATVPYAQIIRHFNRTTKSMTAT